MSEVSQTWDWSSYLEVFVDLANVLSWPLVILFLGLFFRFEIRSIIPRIDKIGPGGLGLSSPKQFENTPNNLSSAHAIPEGELDELQNPIAADLEKKNREDLDALGPKGASERENILLRALTVQQMMKSFGIAYSGIFGSQIRALHILNSRRINRADAEQMFSSLKKENPSLEKFSLELYMAYLLHWRFVSVENDVYFITETGRDFLKFLLENRLSEDRLN